MVRLAVAATPGWEVSDLELTREGPSYTFDTLTTIAAEGLNPLQMFFIIGADAFAEIETWYRFPKVLDLAHFVVVARPGTRLASLKQRLPRLAARMCAPWHALESDSKAIGRASSCSKPRRPTSRRPTSVAAPREANRLKVLFLTQSLRTSISTCSIAPNRELRSHDESRTNANAEASFLV
jgi:nicotinate (nicotinamide) nucleotide adenylyltransferase